MKSEDVKNFLFDKTGIPQENWKRLSKHKASDGSEVRVFQDKVSQKTLETIENKDGISISRLIVTSLQTQANIVGYYQFDDELFSVALVTKSFWEKYGHLDDSGSEEQYVPPRFFELAEGVYEHDFSNHQEACDTLEKAGWVAKKLFG